MPANGPEKKPEQVTQRGLFNFVLTIGLLVFGAMSVFQSVGDFLNPSEVINQALASLNAQNAKFPLVTYSHPEISKFAGSLLLTLQGANFGLITWWAIRRLRTGKISFWVPLVGAAVSSILTLIVVGLMMTGDSTVMNAFIDFVKASTN